jgi:hypothetical protein
MTGGMPTNTAAESPGSAHGSTTGLTSAEVIDLRCRYGLNDIPEEKKNPLLKFLSYFWGPIAWMIEIAAILSAVISHWDDFAIILLLLMINAVVGFFQERKAENAIELLKKQLAPNARVLQDGTWQEIPAREPSPVRYPNLRTSTGLFALRTTENGVLSCKNFSIQFLLWAHIRISETFSSSARATIFSAAFPTRT